MATLSGTITRGSFDSRGFSVAIAWTVTTDAANNRSFVDMTMRLFSNTQPFSNWTLSRAIMVNSGGDTVDVLNASNAQFSISAGGNIIVGTVSNRATNHESDGSKYWDVYGIVDAVSDSSFVPNNTRAPVSGTSRITFPNIYTISFNANGGTVGTTSTRSAHNDSITLPTPTRSGYTFSGWFDGSTNVGSGGSSYTTTATKTLVAGWTINEYTVTYDANGGSVSPSSQNVTPGNSVTTPTPSRPGTEFGGWYDGNTFVAGSGQSYTPSGSVTLTARWEYSVSFNANGGTFSAGSSSGYSVLVGNSFSLPTVTRTNYTFSGWYTAASGGTFIGSAGASFTPTSTGNTYYARWTANTPVFSDSSITTSTFRVGTPYSESNNSVTASPVTSYSISGISGLSINSSGIVSGTPITAGTFDLTITANNDTASQSISFNGVQVKPRIPAWTDSVISETMRVGSYYADSVSALYATSYAFKDFNYPPGLQINSSGTIFGTPTTAGQYTFKIVAKNSINEESAEITLYANVALPGGRVAVYQDNDFIEGTVHVYNGSIWKESPVYVFDGTSWVLTSQIT